MLSNCNSLSGSRLERANKDFHKHISHLNEVKKDLEFIFKKVRSIKTKMAKNNSDAFLGKPILKKCNDFLPLFQSLISNFYFISCGWKFRTCKRRRWWVRCCYQKEISRKRFKTRWYTWYRLSVKIIFLLSSNFTLFWVLLQKVQKIRILKFQNSYSKLFSTLPVHSRDPKNQPYFISNPIQLPTELTKVE